jgi:hypothetical protein
MTSVAQAPERAILTHFSPYAANLLSMAVREPIRRGESDPATIRGAAEARLLAWEGRDDRHRDATRAALDAMAAHPDELAPFIGHCADWERLPGPERERLKAQRGDEHRRRWLEEEPATPKQRDYLRGLGYTGAIRSKAHASQLVDELKRARVA